MIQNNELRASIAEHSYQGAVAELFFGAQEMVKLDNGFWPVSGDLEFVITVQDANRASLKIEAEFHVRIASTSELVAGAKIMASHVTNFVPDEGALPIRYTPSSEAIQYEVAYEK